jgi:hypothetical protein
MFQEHSIYAVVPDELVSKHMSFLHETATYSLSLFDISAEKIPGYPIQNPLAIMFTDLTVIEPILNPDDSFPQWTYRLIPFGELPALVTPRRFVGMQFCYVLLLPCIFSVTY